MRKSIAVLAGILMLAAVNWTIYGRERLLETGQVVLLAAFNSSLSKQFKLTLPNTNTASFSAFVRKFASNGGVDQIVKRQAELRITGAVTWA